MELSGKMRVLSGNQAECLHVCILQGGYQEGTRNTVKAEAHHQASSTFLENGSNGIVVTCDLCTRLPVQWWGNGIEHHLRSLLSYQLVLQHHFELGHQWQQLYQLQITGVFIFSFFLYPWF